MESHLLQMRGLKQQLYRLYPMDCFVASFTDAWIETCILRRREHCHGVASFTDAWIET